MKTKYQCKRCGNIIAIKVPNCPLCSSCDGYKQIQTETKTPARSSVIRLLALSEPASGLYLKG